MKDGSKTSFFKRSWKTISTFFLLGGFSTLCFMLVGIGGDISTYFAENILFWFATLVAIVELIISVYFDIKARSVIRTISCVLGMIVFRALIIIGMLFYIFTPNNFEPIPFDSAVWKGETVAQVSSSYPRLHMVKDLRKKTNDLNGFSAREVEELLGPLEPHSRLTSPYDYAYYLGSDGSGISLGANWLAIDFEEDHVVGIKEIFISD